MHKRIGKITRSQTPTFQDQHRYEHWLVDKQIYFMTARCRDQFKAFASEQAKCIFWDRFDHYALEFGYEPWVTSLLDNHYHSVGYLRVGATLTKMIQRIHGSVAKLVNDSLPNRFPDFWRDAKGHEYFDGCLRDEKQGRLTYRYVLTQGVRHGIVGDWRRYPHTRVRVDMDDAISRAIAMGAFLTGIPYKRYASRG